MTNIFSQFWKWLVGTPRSSNADWREWLEERASSSITESLVPIASAAAAGSETALPAGLRQRALSSGYSMTVAQSDELKRLLKKIRPLPQGAMKVMQELDTQDSSSASVAEAIKCEPVMAASMVRIANSTAMGLRREITSVSDAVTYLGYSTTKSLLLRFNMDSALPSSKPGQGYDSGKLWVHGMAVAQAAEEIARRAGRTDSSLALTAGLLHDIGKLAINSQYPDNLPQLFAPDADPSEGLLNRERRLFQADHAIIGGTLASEWKLPHDLIEIVRLHHTHYGEPIDLQPEARRALFSVQIANQLVKFRHVYCEGMEFDEIPPAMTAELGLPGWLELLTDKRLQSLIDRVVLLNSSPAEAPARAA